MSTTVLVSLEAVVCTCGCVFGLAADHKAQLQRTHETFHCPKGCTQHYPGESREEKLRKQLEATEKRLQFVRDDRDMEARRASAAERSAKATRGHLTRVKKRAHAGVCIHCNRTFPKLAQHMATKHAGEHVE